MKHKYNVGKANLRSKLEDFCWKELTAAGLVFQYEPVTVTLLDSFKYESLERTGKQFKVIRSIRPITYTPDFVGDKFVWVIETKGMQTDGFRLKWKLFKDWLIRKSLQPRLYLPSNQREVMLCIEDIVKYTNDVNPVIRTI